MRSPAFKERGDAVLSFINPFASFRLDRTGRNCSTLFYCQAFNATNFFISVFGRSQWPRGLRRRSAAARLLGSWVRIPPGAWTFVCCKCCVLSVKGLCDELSTRPEESYRLWCVAVCDLLSSCMRRPKPINCD